MASSGEKGFSLHVGIYIAKKDEEAWWALFKPVFDLVTAMPECVFFELYKADVDGETDIVNISWVENWTESFEWFQEEQLPKDAMKNYLASTEPMFVKPREVKVLKRVGPPFYSNKQ